MELKSDLHFHPGEFWGPVKSGAKIQNLIARANNQEMNLIALTSCHDSPTRYEYYLRQAEQLAREGVAFEADSEKGIFSLPGLQAPIYFLDGQEIKGKDGDINIICPGQTLNYALYDTPVEDVAKHAKDLGALVSLPHLFGRDGLGTTLQGQDKASQLADKDLIDFFETWDALDSPRHNRKAFDFYTFLEEQERCGSFPIKVAVSDGHYDSDLGAAATEFNIHAITSMQGILSALRHPISTKDYLGYISKLNKARYATSLVIEIALGKVSTFLGRKD